MYTPRTPHAKGSKKKGEKWSNLGAIASPVEALGLEVTLYLSLPAVAIGKELFLVVEELLVRLSSILEIGALDDGVHGARLLAHTAVDALGHVDVIPRGLPGPVLPLLCLNRDGLRRAYLQSQSAVRCHPTPFPPVSPLFNG